MPSRLHGRDAARPLVALAVATPILWALVILAAELWVVAHGGLAASLTRIARAAATHAAAHASAPPAPPAPARPTVSAGEPDAAGATGAATPIASGRALTPHERAVLAKAQAQLRRTLLHAREAERELLERLQQTAGAPRASLGG